MSKHHTSKATNWVVVVSPTLVEARGTARLLRPVVQRLHFGVVLRSRLRKLAWLRADLARGRAILIDVDVPAVAGYFRLLRCWYWWCD